jgi:hypothetical protein
MGQSVYRIFKRTFATAATRTTQSGSWGKAVRPSCFLRIPRAIWLFSAEILLNPADALLDQTRHASSAGLRRRRRPVGAVPTLSRFGAPPQFR